MRRRVRTLALLAALALAAPATRATAIQQIAQDSTVHRVEAVYVSKLPPLPALRHTVLRPDGTSQTVLLPGTADEALDSDPALAIDAVTGDAIVTWSRNEGHGFDIWLSRYHGGTWSSPLRVLDAGADESRPQIRVTPSLVHVTARSGDVYLRISLDRASLQPAFGPETLPTSGPTGVPGDGELSLEPPPDQVFFASDVLPPTDTESGRIVIWGVRDEPVPIDYVQVLLVPTEISPYTATLVAPIEGVLTVTVPANDRIWYTLRLQSAWHSFGAVERGEDTSLSDVTLMLADMIRRVGE
jgi:hypothetical protein